jgi:hypothetical protein
VATHYFQGWIAKAEADYNLAMKVKMALDKIGTEN